MIKYYEYLGSEREPWKFAPATLSKINLLVGTSGSGKTRFLNTLFNFSEFVTKGNTFRAGRWILKVDIGEDIYEWIYEGIVNEDEIHLVKYELLKKISGTEETIIIRRDLDNFVFMDKPLPKLEKDILSVTLLKEEDILRPLYNVFSHVMRRRFHDSSLNDSVTLSSLSKNFINKLRKNPVLDELWKHDFPIQNRLYIFNEIFKDKYYTAIKFFTSVFPTIEHTEIKILNAPSFGIDTVVPIFLIREKGVKELIPLSELSSGMQKVLLIITDILSLTENCIYIIDEYENSLGINAIDFLPEFLINNSGNNQFIITTHHPYLINNMPIKNWLVFNRRGSTVEIKSGSEFEEKFGKSKQKAFIQLLSDPFYTGE